MLLLFTATSTSLPVIIATELPPIENSAPGNDENLERIFAVASSTESHPSCLSAEGYRVMFKEAVLVLLLPPISPPPPTEEVTSFMPITSWVIMFSKLRITSSVASRRVPLGMVKLTLILFDSCSGM